MTILKLVQILAAINGSCKMKKSEIWIVAYIYSIICFIIYFGIKEHKAIDSRDELIEVIQEGNIIYIKGR